MTDVPPPGPAPRRPNTVRRVLIIIAVVLVVCCAGAVAAGYGLFRWYSSAAGPAQATTETFLADLERDDTAGAYGLLCNDSRSHLSRDSFTNLVHAQPRLRSHKIVGTSVSTVNGTTTALITADLTRDGGVRDRHTVRLVKDGSAWRVCGDPY
jgi:hypothetical protein